MAKKYYWLKLKNNFFQQKEVKKLRKIAGGDTYTIIYLKLQLLSITNDGVLVFEGTESDLVEQLSLEIDETPDNIRITLAFLQANKLIEEYTQDHFLLTKVPECIGKESASAERMRRKRLKDKQKQEQKQLKASQCDTNVQTCYTEIEKEKEKDKDIDIEVEIEREKIDIDVLKKVLDKKK